MGSRGPRPGTMRRPIRHGTNAGYTAHCRYKIPICQPCRDAHTRYQQDRKLNPPARPIARHGTNSGYSGHRKRGEEACGPCKAAHNEYVKLYKSGVRISADPAEERRMTVPGFSFGCDCGHVELTIGDLVRHVVGTHRRPPTAGERTPRRASEAA